MGLAKKVQEKDDQILVSVQQELAAGVCFVSFLLVPGCVLVLRLKCSLMER